MSFEEAKKLDDHFVMHTFARKPVLLVEGSGMEVKDDEGKTYLDFIAGIGVDSLGHCHPAVVRAIQDQAAKLIHVSNYYYIEQRGEVAKLLSDMLNVCVPKFFRAPWPVFFANSGAEANECAIKLARLYSKKMGGGGQTIITMDRSFHPGYACRHGTARKAGSLPAFAGWLPTCAHERLERASSGGLQQLGRCLRCYDRTRAGRSGRISLGSRYAL